LSYYFLNKLVFTSSNFFTRVQKKEIFSQDLRYKYQLIEATKAPRVSRIKSNIVSRTQSRVSKYQAISSNHLDFCIFAPKNSSIKNSNISHKAPSAREKQNAKSAIVQIGALSSPDL